jgi:hypothetical protein
MKVIRVERFTSKMAFQSMMIADLKSNVKIKHLLMKFQQQ